MHKPSHNYLFNFSSSYSGGGLKILCSYLDFFDKNSGAYFIVNSRLKEELSHTYPNNTIFFVKVSKLKRLFNDMYYLKPILDNIPRLDLYFSYGIPVYKKIARNNWFHVSNMIPIDPQANYLGALHILQMKLLGHRIKKYAKYADFLSADSLDAANKASAFIKHEIKNKVVLKNGIDGSFIKLRGRQKSKTAITVGTQPYKDLGRLFSLYKMLQETGKVESLIIIGAQESVPNIILEDPSVLSMGTIESAQVYEELAKASIYITTSLIENSSVAALEGLYLCSHSYLSQIGPHREMLEDAQLEYESIDIDELGPFYVVKNEVPSEYIDSISWDSVNLEFYNYLKENLS